MNAPPKKRAAVLEPPKSAELPRPYAGFGFLQPARLLTRRCVSCGRFVGNSNLGGYDGKSALSGRLWCLRCADGRHCDL
jgi:hypothetical protein